VPMTGSWSAFAQLRAARSYRTHTDDGRDEAALFTPVSPAPRSYAATFPRIGCSGRIRAEMLGFRIQSFAGSSSGPARISSETAVGMTNEAQSCSKRARRLDLAQEDQRGRIDDPRVHKASSLSNSPAAA